MDCLAADANSLRQIGRGVWLFVGALVVALAILLEFQRLSLWLPGFVT